MEKILELCGEFISGANVECVQVKIYQIITNSILKLFRSLTFNNIKERLRNLEEPEISAFLEDKSQWKAIKPEITKLLQVRIKKATPYVFNLFKESYVFSQT